MKVQIEEKEWKEWLVHPVTQRFREFLQELVAGTQAEWVNGTFTKDTCEATAMLNAEALGRVGAVLAIAEFDYSVVCGDQS